MDMGGMAPPAAPAPAKKARYMHMTFFWGKNTEVLFTLWPGTRGGMYALALVFMFALAVLLEFRAYRALEARARPRTPCASASPTSSCSRSCRSTVACCSPPSRATPPGSWRSGPACAAGRRRRWRRTARTTPCAARCSPCCLVMFM
uniref:Copper transport protein n=1 Tax=Oryza brachyantha TaxID=4533 RepID=J3M7C3_ORYBR